MASPRRIVLLNADGTKSTGAACTFLKYVQKDTGDGRTEPAVPHHIGGGEHVFTPSDADEEAGTIAIVDAGENVYPRYSLFCIFKPSQENQFWGALVLNLDGSLWGGTAPTLAPYQDASGAARLPEPPVVALTTYLVTVTPSAADIAARTSMCLNPPADSGMPFFFGSTTDILVANPAPVPVPPSSSSLAPSDIEAALRTAVLAASGLKSSQVVFANQKGRPKNGTYVTVDINGPFTVGGPKGETIAYEPSAPAGEEIKLSVVGPGRIIARLEAFTLRDTHSPNDARAIMERTQIGMQLSVIRDPLRAAGITIYEFGDVVDMARVWGADYEGRAALELRCYVVQSADARVGYIATVKGVVELKNSDGDVVAEAEIDAP